MKQGQTIHKPEIQTDIIGDIYISMTEKQIARWQENDMKHEKITFTCDIDII